MKKFFPFVLLLLFVSCGSDNYKEKIENSIGMELVYIKPGTFTMGRSHKMTYIGNEKEVQHKVTLTNGFYMQTTEVTIGQWKKFIKETHYKTQPEKDGYSWYWTSQYKPIYDYENLKKVNGVNWKNPGYRITDNLPVCLISWDDCKVFLKWLSKKENENYRLPTEAEWEYACRAGTNTHFPGGNLHENFENLYEDEINPALDRIAWYCINSGGKPNPVGLKKKNPWGLYDILGNVEEYCEDNYKRKYPSTPQTDPLVLGNLKGMKVYRGGAWLQPQWFVTSAARLGGSPNLSDNTIGFRVVKDISEKDKMSR